MPLNTLALLVDGLLDLPADQVALCGGQAANVVLLAVDRVFDVAEAVLHCVAERVQVLARHDGAGLDDRLIGGEPRQSEGLRCRLALHLLHRLLHVLAQR